MKNAKFAKSATRFVAYTAVMTALTYVGTLIGFSGAQFYFNLGDSVILICASLFGPIPAMIAGGLGAFFADLTVYPATMLFTLVIKALEGLIAGMLFKLVKFMVKRAFGGKFSTSTAAAGFSPAHSRDSMEEGEFADSDADGATDVGASGATADDNSAPTDLSENIQNSLSGSDYICDAQDGTGEGDPDNAPHANDMAEYDENSTLSKEKCNSNSDSAQKRTNRVAAVVQILLSFAVCIFSSAFMMTGYFVCQTFFYGTYATALVALPMDAAQAAISSVVAVAALYGLKLERLTKRFVGGK